MKVYISASCANKLRAAYLAYDIAAIPGYEVVSSWHWAPLNECDDGVRDRATFEEQRKHAETDLEELDSCDLIIGITEPAGSPYSRGGRHIEFGYAIAQGKRTAIIGPTENVFYTIADLRFPSDGDPFDWERGVNDCLEYLRESYAEKTIGADQC